MSVAIPQFMKKIQKYLYGTVRFTAERSTVASAVPTLACWWKVVFFYSACVVLIDLFAQIKTRRMDFIFK
jgi:hypothetical protein